MERCNRQADQKPRLIAGLSIWQSFAGLPSGTVDRRYGIDRVSLLKLDIEGAEREVFRKSSPGSIK